VGVVVAAVAAAASSLERRMHASATQERRDNVSPLRLLVSSGWLDPAVEHDPRLRVELATSSHALYRVIAPDGRAVVVKQVPDAAAASGRSLDRELFVYRLGRWIPAIAAALPEAVLIDEKHQALVTESLGDIRTWPSADANVSICAPGVAERVGALMAGCHRDTQETGLWPAPALGILEMPDRLELAQTGRAQTTQLLMKAIVDDSELAALLRSTRAGWRDRCLIHGDLRRENWIAARDGRGVTLKIIDWELSGSGDPAWDLGGILAEAALEAVRNPACAKAERWSPPQEAAARAFFDVYESRGGLIDRANTDACAHVVGCAVARLLHVACEWAELQSDVESGPVRAVMAQARLLLRERPRLIANSLWREG